MSKAVRMTKSKIDWDLIDDYAERLGVSYWARRKWRQRNHVPWKWRIALSWLSKERINLDWFSYMDRQNRRNAA